MTDLTGQIINDYTIKSRLGSGGQTVVYLASHEKFDEDVVLRCALPEYVNDPKAIERLEIEATIFFRLKHPYVVPLLDYWRNDSGVWLIQKYMAKGSLRDKITASGALPLSGIADMLDTVSQALEYAHDRNIIHRDIKPSNILFDDTNVAYVHDFGVAKRLKAIPITNIDVMIGSPAYLSPEQITKQVITPQTDVYIMGITLFEAITGKHPFLNVHTKTQLIVKHLRSPLPSVTQLRENIPTTIDSVLQIATAKNSNNRYPSMTALSQAFRDAIRVAG
jgi:eukaryotic-like serine/threonine-protein kinase